MSKHYVPKIQEFYEGFRFEYQEIEYAQWTHQEYSEGLEFEGIKVSEWLGRSVDSFDNNIRVRYLDQQDIEELGWIKDTRRSAGEYMAFYIESNGFDNFKYSLTVEGQKIQIFYNAMYFPTMKSESRFNCLFHGHCKNYNELKTIMEQTEV